MSIDRGRFNWFEHFSNAQQAAQSFYAEVLPWTIESFALGEHRYPMIKSGDAPVGGFAALPTGVTQPHWSSFLLVDDVDASAAAVVAAGGKTLMPAQEVPTIGRMQTVADPHGATLVLFRTTDDSSPAPTGAGTFHWNELWSPDPAASVAFYERAFGFTHSEMPSPGGTYYILKNGEVSRGGIMASPSAAIPAHWLPYVAVDDLDATLARVQRNRGSSEGEPMTMPGVGRFAFIRDPLGARLGLITPTPRG